MTKVLEACEIADEDPLSVNALESIGFRILCKSCEGGNIVMDPSSVVCFCVSFYLLFLTRICRSVIRIATTRWTFHS